MCTAFPVFLGFFSISPMSRPRQETADTLASGASGGNPVQVQVLSSALEITRVYVNEA